MKEKANAGVLFSGGKDSMLALTLAGERGYDIKCLITIMSKNPDSYMFHTPNIRLTKLQAKALSLPIITKTTNGKENEELKDLLAALKTAKSRYKLNTIVTGAIFSSYQKSRIEKLCKSLNITAFSPLWHLNQRDELNLVLKKGIKFIITHIAAEGLDKSWLNKTITRADIEKLRTIRGINIAGEGGEFESFVTDSPFFRAPLEITKHSIMEHSRNNATLIITDAKLSQSRQ